MKNTSIIYEDPPDSVIYKKITVGIVLMVLFSLISGDVSAQSTFNLSFEKVSIATVLEEVKNQSDISLIYNTEEVAKCKPVTIFVSNATLEEVLENCLKNTVLTYKNINGTIVISPRPPAKENEPINSEQLIQTVRGTLIDIDSKLPLIGATIVIIGSDPTMGAITDIDGNFRMEKVPIGRISLQLSYVGYERTILDNIIVTSAKEVVINTGMQESIVKMEDVVVLATKEKGEATNDMSLISVRSISTEESSRYAGPFNDPTRIMSNYAGVATTNDGSNDIIVRGNSPKYMQWRLEGVQITNPNHFGDQNGVSQSGISALNNNLLATSDFHAGAFSPEFGDVLSGVYDINLRAGNNEKYESIFGFGILGTDITVEGPFKKGYEGSFLANYRYSTVGLVSKLGIVDFEGGVPTYQDAVFKLVLPTKKIGSFSLFGLGGASSFLNLNLAPSDAAKSPGSDRPSSEDINKDHESLTQLANIGLNHTISLSSSSYLNTTFSHSTELLKEEVNEADVSIINDEEVFSNRQLTYESKLLKSVNRAAVTYSNKINPNHKIQIGTKLNLFDYNYDQKQFQYSDSTFFSLIDMDENILTLRNFVSWRYRVKEGITIVSGLHNMNVLYNNKSTLEPRIGINWQIDYTNSIHAGYGKHSTMESIHNYFAKVKQPDGSVMEPNRDLGLLKADHYVVGYQKRFNDHLMAKFEVYYQHLYNLPVANNDTSYYATINEGIDYRYVDLVNEGTGKNYGVELTVERFFNNNFYFLYNASLYESKYTSLEGIERNTNYNGKYLMNILIGKEFVELGEKRNRTLGLNFKAFYGGGKRQVLLKRDAMGNVEVDPASNDYFDYENAYEDKIEDLYQITISANYKWEKPKTTQEIWLSLDNVTNTLGKTSEFYDADEPNSVGYATQFGFFPNLMFRVYF